MYYNNDFKKVSVDKPIKYSEDFLYNKYLELKKINKMDMPYNEYLKHTGFYKKRFEYGLFCPYKNIDIEILECFEPLPNDSYDGERCLFSNYSFLDKEILNISPLIYDDMKKTNIYDINELRKIFDWIVDYSSEIIYKTEYISTGMTADMYMDEHIYITPPNLKDTIYVNPICGKDKQLLIDQLVFDILFEKYYDDQGEYTIEDYCYTICNEYPDLAEYYDKDYDYSTSNSKQDLKTSINGMRQTIELHIKRLANTKDKIGIRTLGFDLDDYIAKLKLRSNSYKNVTSKNMVKSTFSRQFLDYVFFSYISFPNFEEKKTDTGRYKKKMLILKRQREQTYGLEDKNRSYDDFIIDNKIYDDFIDTFTTGLNTDDEAYFQKTMQFYNLETEHRLEYLYNISVDLANHKFDKMEIDNYFCLSQRFTPHVSYPQIKDNKLIISSNKPIYKFMLLHDEYYQKQLFNNKDFKMKISYMLNRRIRAKSFEIFKYFYNFTSNDYKQISEFIKGNYNLLGYYNEKGFVKGYYNPDKIWQHINSFKNKDFENTEIINSLKSSNFIMDNNKTYSSDEIKNIVNRLILLNIKMNETLFPKTKLKNN